MHMNRILAAITLTALVTLAGCGGAQSGPPKGNVTEAEKIAAQGRASGPMPDNAFKAAITVPQLPDKMLPGEKTTLLVKVKNTGNAAWPARGRLSDGYFQVNLGNIWFDSANKPVVNHPYVRSGLHGDLGPGQEAEVSLTIIAPDAPGEYTLQIDLVQEMVAWFSAKGSTAPKFKIHVGA